MPDATSSRLQVFRLILIPSLITLAVTVFRLAGELQNWSKAFFNPDPGGPLGIVGIVWLVPIFGIYFAVRLAKEGFGPAKPGRAILFASLSLVILVVAMVLTFVLGFAGSPTGIIILAIGAAIAIWAHYSSWPESNKVLLAYGYAARIPVVIIMFFAIRDSWGTHYDGPPPTFPTQMAWFPKFVLIGLVPQLVMWVAFTGIVGSLFGSIVVAVMKPKTAVQTA